jgi:hypothetical protein
VEPSGFRMVTGPAWGSRLRLPLAEEFADPINCFPVCLRDLIPVLFQVLRRSIPLEFEHFTCCLKEQDGASADLIVLYAGDEESRIGISTPEPSTYVRDSLYCLPRAPAFSRFVTIRPINPSGGAVVQTASAPVRGRRVVDNDPDI